MDRFPLPPGASYRYEQRFNDQHRGIDIMAPLGTPLVAVAAGNAWREIDDKGGNVVYLVSPASSLFGSGETYYYAHLSGWDSRLREAVHRDHPAAVKAGDVLGTVGNTGNAKGGPTHVHFQIRRGSLVVDPFDDLQAVDPHRERGSRPRSAAPSAVLLFVVAWFLLSRKG